MHIPREVRPEGPHSVTVDDASALFDLSCDRVVLEIGTYSGYSTKIMSYNAIKIITIDPFILGMTYKMIKESFIPYKNIELIYGYSHDVIPNLQDNYFDLLFIDGDHNYNSVINDFEVSIPKLKNNSIVLFHDYNKSYSKSVVPAVDFLANKYKLTNINLNMYGKDCHIKGFVYKNE